MSEAEARMSAEIKEGPAIVRRQEKNISDR